MLERLAALGMILACSATTLNPLPAALIVLIVIDGVRFGLIGVIGAGIVAALAVGGTIALQVLMLGVLRPASGMVLLVRWEAVIVLAGVAVGFFLWLSQEWLRHEQTQWEHERAALCQQVQEERRQREHDHAMLQRLQSGLSGRERELLPLPAREELTYEQIADILCVSIDTVKTHVHRLGQKVGTTGRWAIVAAARERGLLPPRDA